MPKTFKNLSKWRIFAKSAYNGLQMKKNIEVVVVLYVFANYQILEEVSVRQRRKK